MKKKKKSFSDCKICSELPNILNIDLEDGEEIPKAVNDFKVLWEERIESNHEIDHKKIMQCKLCDTYYYFYYGFDNEDSPSTPITSVIKIKRWDLQRAKKELAKVKKK